MRDRRSILKLRSHFRLLWLLTVLALVLCSGCKNAKPPSSKTVNEGSSPSAAETSPSPEDTGAFDSGLASYRAKDYESAVASLERAVKSDPANAEASYYLGKSYLELDRTAEAAPAFKQAIESKPDFAEAHYELGKIYFDQKDYQRSLPYLKNANKYNTKWPDALVLLGDNYRMLNQLNYAAVPYGKAIGFDENRADAYFGLGMTYVGIGNKVAARQQLRKLEPLNAKLAEQLRDSIDKM